MVKNLNDLLAPILAEYKATPEWQAVTDQAYPADKPAVKPKKQPKDKGDPAKRAAAMAARQAQQASGVASAQAGVENLEIE